MLNNREFVIQDLPPLKSVSNPPGANSYGRKTKCGEAMHGMSDARKETYFHKLPIQSLKKHSSFSEENGELSLKSKYNWEVIRCDNSLHGPGVTKQILYPEN